MRSTILQAVVIVGMLLSATSVVAETVEVPDKHFSIYLPPGWWDETPAGSEYDLELASSFGVVCYIDSDSWTGEADFEHLYDELQKALYELEDMGYNISAISPIENITVNGIKGIDVTLTTIVSVPGPSFPESVTVKERLVVFASESWSLAWALAFAGREPGFSLADADMDAIVNSFTVEEKSGGGYLSKSAALVIGLVVVVVVVIVVALLLVRKKPAPYVPAQAPPPQVPPGPPWPPPPPPTQ